MINRYITAAILVTTLSCSHLANAEFIRVIDGETVSAPASESTTIWNIDNGNLLGAFNVNVDGTLWDVRFIDGLFDIVFTDASFVEVRTVSEAGAFSGALSELVIRDVAPYLLDSRPASVFGCSVIEYCELLTPFGLMHVGGVFTEVSIYQNIFGGGGDSVNNNNWYSTQFDTTNAIQAVWAVWEQKVVEDIPEPATFSILALGLIGLASRRFKKQP